MPKLSIIIVNWNSGHYLRECLPSIFSGIASLPFEVIVVDSASTRDDIPSLAAEFPSVRFVRSAENIGFARANNLGYSHSSGELLLFLNPDTIVVGSAIEEMVRTIESLPRAGILGCRLLNTDGSVQISALQAFPTILNQLLGSEYLQMKHPHSRLWKLGPLFSNDRRPVQVEGVSGACLLIRREVFAEVGLFSSEYFMYAEDIDLCRKASLAGWHTWFAPTAVVVHHGGGSSSQQPAKAWAAVAQEQAKFQFLAKFRGTLYAQCFRFAMGIAAILRVAALATANALRRKSRSPHLPAALAKWSAIFKWSFRFNIA